MNLRHKFKKQLKKPATVQWMGWIIAKIISGVYRTIRWEYRNEEIPQKYWKANQPFIVAFWHNRLAMTCFAWRHSGPFHMLISSHPDGQIIARTVENHGIQTIAGSRSKGGTEAMRKLLKVLKKGETIGITPDGPRGPRFSVHEGVLHIAKIAKVDILPLSFSTQRRYLINSWDRLWIPLPFGKGIFQWGDPLPYEQIRDMDISLAKERLKERMINLSNQADHACGHPPIPGPKGRA